MSTERHLPSQAEWLQIQGGSPLIIGNEASTIFQIVHVYSGIRSNEQTIQIPEFDTELAQKIGHYGCIVDTPVTQMNSSVKKPVDLLLGSDLTTVTVPAVMLIDKHGKPCAQRTRSSGSERGYSSVGNPKDWRFFLEGKRSENCDIWEVKSESGRFKLSLLGLLANYL